MPYETNQINYNSITSSTQIDSEENGCVSGIPLLRILSWIFFPIGIVLECTGYWDKKEVRKMANDDLNSSIKVFQQVFPTQQMTSDDASTPISKAPPPEIAQEKRINEQRSRAHEYFNWSQSIQRGWRSDSAIVNDLLQISPELQDYYLQHAGYQEFSYKQNKMQEELTKVVQGLSESALTNLIQASKEKNTVFHTLLDSIASDKLSAIQAGKAKKWVLYLEEQKSISLDVSTPFFDTEEKKLLYTNFKRAVLERKQPDALFAEISEDDFIKLNVLLAPKNAQGTEDQKKESTALFFVLKAARAQKTRAIHTADWGKTNPLTQKISLVTKAIQLLETVYCSERVETDTKKYLQNVLERLRLGENVPIPRWYHATGERGKIEPVKAILDSKKLVRGDIWTPVCFSSGPEYAYGEFTFAFDHHNAFEKQDDVQCEIQGKHMGDVRERMWINISGELDVSPNTVAFISTKAENVDRIKEVAGKDIQIIDREVCEMIRYLFETAEDVGSNARPIPSTWKKEWRR